MQTTKGIWKHFGTLVACIIFAASLSACGGGSSNTTPTGSTTTPFSTNAASTVNVSVGQSATFIATGGGDGTNFTTYSISSNTPNVAKVSILNGQFTITGVALGQAIVTVSDTGGDKQSITVNVTAAGSGSTSTTVSIEAPAAISLVQGNSATYGIVGGAGSYVAASSNPTVAAATISGSNLVITGKSQGIATIAVYDTNGNSANLSVNVASATGVQSLITTAPSSISVNNGTQASYVIFGGVAPYEVATSNQNIVSANVSNTNTLTINGLSLGTGVVQITDNAHNQIQINVTVGSASSGSALTVTAPASVTIGSGVTSTYNINGGIGPYTATSGNTNLVATSVNGNVLSVKGLATGGPTQVALFDSTGASKLISVTVTGGAVPSSLYTTAPSAVTINTGASASYQIGGGTAPYTVTSSATGVASVTVSGSSYTVTGVAPGTATVAIVDSLGVAINVGVTIH